MLCRFAATQLGSGWHGQKPVSEAATLGLKAIGGRTRMVVLAVVTVVTVVAVVVVCVGVRVCVGVVWV